MARTPSREQKLIASSPALSALYSMFQPGKVEGRLGKRTQSLANQRIAVENSMMTGIHPGQVKAPGSGGGGVNWKSIGGNLLNALTVPGAVAVTTNTNLVRALSGQDLVSWKNLGGTFRGDKFAGGSGFLESFGVDKSSWAGRIGGLGIDVVADPTWLLSVIPGAGQVYAGAKIASLGKRAETLAKFVETAASHKGTVQNASKIVEDVTRELSEAAIKGGSAEAAKIAPQALGRAESALADSLKAEAGRMSMGKLPYLRLGLPFAKKGGLLVPLTGKVRGAKPMAEMLDKVQSSAFRMSPTKKLAQQLRRSVRGLEDMDSALLQSYAAEKGFTNTQKQLIFLAANVASDSKTKWEEVKQSWLARGEGWWNADMDEALHVLQSRGKTQAEQMGLKSFDEQGKLAESWLRPQLGEVADLEGSALRGIERMNQMGLDDAARRADATFDAGHSAVQAMAREAQNEIGLVAREVQDMQREADRLRSSLAQLDYRIRASNPKLVPRKARARKGEPKGRSAGKQEARKLQTALIAQRKEVAAQLRSLTARIPTREKLIEDMTKAADKAQAQALSDLATRRAQVQGDLVTATMTATQKQLTALQGRLAAMRDKINLGDFQQFARENRLSEFYANAPHAITPKGEWVKPTKRGPNTLAVEDLLPKARVLQDRGPYVPGIASRDTREEVSGAMTERHLAGKLSERERGAHDISPVDPEKMRQVSAPVQILTKDTFIDEAIKGGMSEEEALMAADDIEKALGFAAKDTQWPGMEDIIMRPEMDVFGVAGARHRAQAVTTLHNQLEAMVDDVVKSLYGSKSHAAQMKMKADMLADLEAVQRVGRSDASLMRVMGYIKKHGHEAYGLPRFQYYTAWLKAWFTVMNPGHYVANAVGQFTANLITMNPLAAVRSLGGAIPSSMKVGKGPDLRHLAYFGTKFDSKTGELSRAADAEYLARTFKIGKREMTGWEIAIGARLSGLGMGFTQTEVETFMNLAKGGGTKRIRNIMQMFNMRREDAMRMNSWLEHIKSGDDFLTAAARTIRTHFDYDALTDFERVWMRNLMLFYTWFKNNMVLQAYGVISRPGLYSTLAHYEHARPKTENEPEWWKKSGGIYTPLGMLTFGNPMAEVYKWDLDLDNVRQLTIGGGNPFFRAPVEVLTNRNFFTGGEITKFKGQNTPHWMATVADALGVPGIPQSRARATDAAPSAALPAGIAHLISAFTGPQGGFLATANDPEFEADKELTILSRLSGLRLQPNQPDKFAAAAKAKKTKQKGDATRKKGYESAN